MVRIFRGVLLIVALMALASCGDKFRTYNGPNITRVEVHKSDRTMFLLHGTQIVKKYAIHLGGTPVGKKHFEGDGKTPEGAYVISMRNPNSSYHLSLKISYPNDEDRAFALAAGKPTGGDIFIHGGPPKGTSNRDWTVGCIAVTDRQMEDIYAMVNPGTPIFIYP